MLDGKVFNLQYITDDTGKKVAVILPVGQFLALIRGIQDLASVADRLEESTDVPAERQRVRADLVPVESTMLASVGYDSAAHTLVVLFNSGKAYEYYDVPPEVYAELMAAESKGRYMNANIIDVYPYAPFRGWNRSTVT